jgi:RNA polymerase sigma-70 factor, ECF subfamily
MAVLDAHLAHYPTDSSTHREHRVRQTPRGVSVGREESVASFEEVYAADGPRLVTELYAVTGSLAEAEDVVQEAFVRAYGRWSKVEALDAPSAWIRRVALNLAMSRFRALRRAARHAPRLHGRPEEDRPVPEDTVALVAALGALPLRQRAAIVLHYWADLPVAEIAPGPGRSARPGRPARAWRAFPPIRRVDWEGDVVMNDLPERVAAARTSLMDLVRLAPAAELAAASRRRRRRQVMAIAFAVVAAVGVIPALPRSAPPVATRQPFALDHTISLDGGTLVLSPPDPAAQPLVSSGRAAEVLPRLIFANQNDEIHDLYLAVVASPLADPYAPKTPLRGRLAWVLTTGPNGRPPICPDLIAPITKKPSPRSMPSPRTPEVNALIIDALTGEAMVYKRPLCSDAPPTELKKAYMAYSVPFEMQADGSLIVQLPPCGDPISYGQIRGGADPEVQVLAQVPVAPCPAPSPSPWHHAGSGVRPPVSHAPLGPVIQTDSGALAVVPSPS